MLEKFNWWKKRSANGGSGLITSNEFGVGSASWYFLKKGQLMVLWLDLDGGTNLLDHTVLCFLGGNKTVRN